MLRAALAPTVMSVSGWCSRSDDSVVATICTSLRKPFGKSGRSERSVSRMARMPSEEGRPSRRGNPPGILPTA